MKSIFINDTQIHSNTDNLGFIVQGDIKGLDTPAIRLPSFERPNVDGAIVPNQLYGGRLITLQGKVFASDISTYRTRRRTLETAIGIQRVQSTLYPLLLKFTTMDDLALQAEVYTKGFDCPDREMLYANYKLDLFAPLTQLLGQTLKTSNVYAFTGGGFAIPAAIPFDISAGGSSAATLNNAGNVNAYPIITLYGVLNNPTIVNETTGETMNITYNLDTTAKYIVIDTLNRTVTYYSAAGATGVNVRSALTGDFITLASGDNSIKLTIASYNTTGLAQFAWRDSYSGI
jgi:hypothetical protein